MYLLNILSLLVNQNAGVLMQEPILQQSQVQILHLTNNNGIPLELQSPDLLLQRGGTQFFPFFFGITYIISFCSLEVFIMSVADACKGLSSLKVCRYIFQQDRKPYLLKDIADQFKFQLKKLIRNPCTQYLCKHQFTFVSCCQCVQYL